MQNILVITSSLFGDNGQSSQLVNRFVDQLASRHPQARILRRDLASEPVPHLDAARAGAFFTPAEQRSAEQQAIVAYSDALIDELRQADAIVLGVPMYNFGIPSTLKAYFDHVARAGVTFRYTENGPQGLLNDVPVYVLAARGGLYAGTPNDSQTPYLRSFLGFIGLKQVEFVYAEGLNMGDDRKQDALHNARERIQALAV